jgi:(2Fe-2S) ferredoxin
MSSRKTSAARGHAMDTALAGPAFAQRYVVRRVVARGVLMDAASLGDLPVVFPYHVFCCSQQRPPSHPRGSCGAAGAGALWEKLSTLVQGRQLAKVSMVASGCLGFCSAGPLLVVYPQGVWYAPKTKEDIEELVQTHFVEGRIVERLAVVLTR